MYEFFIGKGGFEMLDMLGIGIVIGFIILLLGTAAFLFYFIRSAVYSNHKEQIDPVPENELEAK